MLKRTVGAYKEIEGSVDIDKDEFFYHDKPYRIPVAHMSLMKKAISEIAKNKALAAYDGDSEWAAPTLVYQKSRPELE